MPDIIVVTEEMTAMANRIGQHAEEIFNLNRKIWHNLKAMSIFFSGDLPDVLVSYIRAINNDQQSAVNVLTRCKDFLNSAAEIYKNADESLKGQIQQWGDLSTSSGIRDEYKPKPSYDAAYYQQYADMEYWNGKKMYTMSNNCWGFVDHILNIEGRNRISGRYSGEAYINGFGSYLIEGGQYIARPTSPSASDIQNIFRNAQIGDVVQMKWNSGTAHTAMIADIDEYGVKFIQSNTNNATINNTYYTWNDLAIRYSYAGYGGGASIYRP